MAHILLLHDICFNPRPHIHIFTRCRARCPVGHQLGAIREYERTQVTCVEHYVPREGKEQLDYIHALGEGEA